jgi:hypothetical protein
VLLRGGSLLGAFTRGQPQLVQSADVVTRLCEEPKTRIEVKAVADLEEPASVSLEEMLAGSAAPAPAFSPRPYAPASSPASSQPVRGYEPAPAVAPQPNSDDAAIDWEGLINQLMQLADNSLQNRSKKIKEMLASTEHNLDALDRTIDRVSQTSIMFVDPVKLTNLANEMRQVVESER